MVVNQENFARVIRKLKAQGQYGLDTETTGLELSDRLFSIILSDESEGYYFNFNHSPDHLGNLPPKEFILPLEWIAELACIFDNAASLFFIHNAKFDMGMLEKEDLSILGQVHCTESIERVVRNNYLGGKPYSLASCAARRGLKKDASVDEYIKEHGLVTKVKVPGKDKLFEKKHFDKVPFPIITRYGETDAILARQIGLDQMRAIAELDAAAQLPTPPMLPLVENERHLTKVCHKMQRDGIKIDRAYTIEASKHMDKEILKLHKKFKKDTGLDFQDSAATLKKALLQSGITLPLTRTGQPCTNKKVLDSLENPLADLIRSIRKHEKIQSTYLSSFLYYADKDDIIHANMRQAGTETGRFSYSDPNLQNVPKEDEPEDKAKPYIIRRCFIPQSSDFCLVPIDYKQQEFRMMLDYAGEKELIAEIMAGADVHDATAKRFGATRKAAKTLNFGLLYGMGNDTLAGALKVPFSEAVGMRHGYFRGLPNVKRFIEDVSRKGRNRGYIFNWFGFRNHISSPEFAYVLPNHLIQGGCAQVLRVAMVRIDGYITDHRLRSRMLAQVHDELLFSVHVDEFKHIAEFKRIMESVYVPRNGLYLECSVEHSFKSWAKFDQVSGSPLAA